ncbi:MAG: flavin reductase family protein [Chloroflexi bacterium]|jgi:flavin reductase (DIM6/NTAB) family NADH-FMN oxidoreductase RutF|nr:flavin reductase family protein [Chloroflexota bacterium]
MPTILVETLAPREAYRLFVSLVIPRPIGWVSTLGADGTRNLAPFSFFNAVGGPPPTVMVSIGRRRGQEKDTLRNLRERGEGVVHLVDEHLVAAANLTSGEWEYHLDEFALAGLATIPSTLVAPPRLRDAAAAMECRVTQIIPVDGTEYTLVLGRVLCFHLRDELLAADGLVDARALRPVARLGRDEYTTLGEIFALARPVSYPR